MRLYIAGLGNLSIQGTEKQNLFVGSLKYLINSAVTRATKFDAQFSDYRLWVGYIKKDFVFLIRDMNPLFQEII